MKRKYFVIALLCIMLLSACDTAVETPEPTSEPTVASTMAPTSTSTPIPTDVPTATLEPTQEPAPAVTEAPEITESQNTPSKRENIPFAEDQLYAVAYLGYGYIENMDYYLENYLDEEEIPNYYFSGEEYYLIIPRYEDMEIRLYRNDMETMGKTLEKECEAGKPFTLQCNISDIFPDATVELTYNGETVEFSPYISLMDGSVQVGDRGLDITKPEPDSQITSQPEDGWLTLTDEEIRWFNEEFFNVEEEIGKNNFLNCTYQDAKSIDIAEIFYNFSEKISKEEKEKLQGSEIDLDTDFQKLSVTYLDGILREFMNVSFEKVDKDGLEYYLFLEEFDAYFGCHGDTNYSRVDVIGGMKDESGTVKLQYLRTEDGKEYIVTLEAHENGYYFVSNVETE